MGEMIRLGELSMERRSEWVDRLFARLSAMYGARFADMWGGLRQDAVKAVWAEDLADLTTEEVARGVDLCRSAKFPPTLPEFRAMCRPPVDAEAAFVEAVTQMALREQGIDRWSHPAIFWAATTVGSFDLRNASWSAIKARWARLLQAEFAKGEWPDVPARRDALPAPGQTVADPARVERVVARVLGKAREAGSQAWIARIEAKAAAGGEVPYIARKMVEAMTGQPLLRGGEHAERPDYADRAAGDDSFGDDEMVPI